MTNKLYIIPDVRTKASPIKESGGIEFRCPDNTVMTGRYHKGDENGQTQYEYSTLKAVDSKGNTVNVTIEVTQVHWHDEIKESGSVLFQAAPNHVIVGRWHEGDENGKTRYATAVVMVNGMIAETFDEKMSNPIKESSGIWFVTDAESVIVGRMHEGDENGQTSYMSARLRTGTFSDEIGDPAPLGSVIVIDKRYTSSTFKESDSHFVCPSNTVLTGMYRSGDENGNTIYEYSTLKVVNSKGEIVNGIITVEDIRWTSVNSESSGIGFDAAINRVIVGRKHYGDENASTQYASGIVKFNGRTTYFSRYTVTEPLKKEYGWFKCAYNQVITARHHYGDENGYTYYGLGQIFCQNQLPANKLPFDVVISLNEKETHFPMTADDFIVLSRFRIHHPNAADSGYNKETNSFIYGNEHSLKYYNIPVGVINSKYSTVKHKLLFNVRPHDDMSVGDDGYFLQTFDNLRGDSSPNGRVPGYVRSLEYQDVDGVKVTYVDIWIFFGYNEKTLSSHQGDWENIMVKVVDDKISGAYLSHHGSLSFNPSPAKFKAARELNITSVNGRQQLTVYCAEGSHALYASVGKFPILNILGWKPDPDVTTENGYKWKVTANLLPISDQPWHLYAGAWGQVGNAGYTTGPLGPWYKRFDFWEENKIDLSKIITSGETIIVPDKYYISDILEESDGISFVAPSDMVLVGRRHGGDENGMTVCMYATLKAIDSSGARVSGEIKIIDQQWSDWIKEASSEYTTSNGFVMLGRQHRGDENGETRYKIGRITFNGKQTVVISAEPYYSYQLYRESKGVFFMTEPYFLYTGRSHEGDENGYVRNLQGLVKLN